MLSLEEQSTNFITMRHIELVRNLLNQVVQDLLSRGEKHDQSKLESPEVELFTKYTAELAGLTYGSAEYIASLKNLKPALDHHYANNRHHPEHFKDGINDMNLIDLIEMFCDWKAASMRHNDGNIRKSIEINAEKHSMNKQLMRIFKNTADYLDY